MAQERDNKRERSIGSQASKSIVAKAVAFFLKNLEYARNNDNYLFYNVAFRAWIKESQG